VFVIEDECHAEQHGQFATLQDALTELRRRATIPWNQEPNVAPARTGGPAGVTTSWWNTMTHIIRGKNYAVYPFSPFPHPESTGHSAGGPPSSKLLRLTIRSSDRHRCASRSGVPAAELLLVRLARCLLNSFSTEGRLAVLVGWGTLALLMRNSPRQESGGLNWFLLSLLLVPSRPSCSSPCLKASMTFCGFRLTTRSSGPAPLRAWRSGVPAAELLPLGVQSTHIPS